jgi:CheY-like chemotaxis protein
MPNDNETILSGKSVLVVDDEAFIQKLVVRILSKFGAEDIGTAEHGQDALDQIDSAAQEPDLILIDMNMPVMGGAELMRNLSDRGFGGAIILASGADPETLAVAQEMASMRDTRVLGYITKPVTPPALAELLAKLNE